MLVLSLARMIHNVGPTIIPGSVSFLTPGTYSFEVPYHHTLFADARGASGGGGGISWSQDDGATNHAGGSGGYSYFNAPTGNVVGYGGAGGQGIDNYPGPYTGANGAHGTGLNGDYNGTGDATTGGVGAAFPTAGAEFYAGNGGNGARAYKTWASGLITPKSLITVVVGAGGARGAEWFGGTQDYSGFSPHSAAGVNGAVYISWT